MLSRSFEHTGGTLSLLQHCFGGEGAANIKSQEFLHLIVGALRAWLGEIFLFEEHAKTLFDETGVLSFGARIPGILAMVGFQQFTLDILVTSCSGLTEVYNNLLHPPSTLTGNTYEIVARILLGFQAVVIFGAKAITPSIKQAVVYTPFYIDKALADGKEIGLPITLEHFCYGNMETVNKRPKEGNFCFSGGRDGRVDTIEYQKSVLT